MVTWVVVPSRRVNGAGVVRLASNGMSHGACSAAASVATSRVVSVIEPRGTSSSIVPFVWSRIQLLMASRDEFGSERKSTTRIPVPNERARVSRNGCSNRVSFWPHRAVGISSATRPLRTSLVCSPERSSSIWSSALSPASRSTSGVTCCTVASWSAVVPWAPAAAMASVTDTP